MIVVAADLPPANDQAEVRDSNLELYQPTDEECRRIVTRFVLESYYQVNGEKVEFSGVYRTFLDHLPNDQRSFWSRVRFTRSLPLSHPAGSGNGNKTFLINLSEKPLPNRDFSLFVDSRGRISKVWS